tara:strand:+ start:1710 stop:3188 length:1479 start_codon:yes stop_codon:yes gene_type:complete
MPIYQIQVSDEVMAATSTEIPVDWISLLFYSYCTGALFFAFRFILQLFSLKKLLGNGKKIRDGKFVLVETDQKSSPFSFFNYLVYNPTLHTQKELDTILIHEKVHAQGLHSVDMIVMHLFIIFQWCNPFIWHFRGCLDDNLEYLADTRTIEQYNDRAEYQHLLLRTGMGENLYSMATPFFNSSIKKRIIMLNKNRSHRKNSFKYAFILPLLAGFIFLFNVKTEAQVKSMDSIQEVNNKYWPVVYDKARSGDFPALLRSSIDNGNTLTDSKNMQPPFYIGDTVPLYILDGREISKTELELINPDSIASINVWKGQQAIDVYGEKGKNGVVVITLKSDYSNTSKTIYGDSLKTGSSSLITHDTIDGSPWVTGKASGVKLNLRNENPLIILDGKETSKSNFEKLKPEEIKTIDVWKGQIAINKYGDKAKDGAIEVTTKSVWAVGYGKMPSKPEKLNAFEGYQQMKSSNQPDIEKALLFIDDVESSVNGMHPTIYI